MIPDWFEVGEKMPDSDTTLLLFNDQASEPVWFGYHDGKRWRYVDGLIAMPTHWASMPAGPTP